MARSVLGLLPLLLVACLLRLQVSDCSSSASSPAEEARKPAGGVPGDALLHHQLDAEARIAASGPTSMALADYGKTSADDGATTPSATPAWDKGVVVAWRPQRQTTSGGRALVGEGLRPAAVLRLSKLARRFLVGVDVDDAGTDGAAASCHSNNVHINCPPASSKP